jgi:hypothetical protein
MPIGTRHFALLVAVSLGACASNQDAVCQSVGDCAQSGSSDWIQGCRAEAKRLAGEANASQCGTQFDAYYACANSNFTCQGATPVFSGCDTKQSALDACLAAATSNTSCARLAAATRACRAAASVDAAVEDSGADAALDSGAAPLPPACTLARDCEALCFLGQVGNVCAPGVAELSNFITCASSCPP